MRRSTLRRCAGECSFSTYDQLGRTCSSSPSGPARLRHAQPVRRERSAFALRLRRDSLRLLRRDRFEDGLPRRSSRSQRRLVGPAGPLQSRECKHLAGSETAKNADSSRCLSHRFVLPGSTLKIRVQRGGPAFVRQVGGHCKISLEISDGIEVSQEISIRDHPRRCGLARL
jgi:hypothetical protein